MKTGGSDEKVNNAFKAKREHILNELGRPENEYTDLSPKGEIDEEIRELVHQINSYEGLVTTSSCAGRVSVFVEGSGKSEENTVEGLDGTESSLRGAPAPGRWLYSSHSPIGATHSSFTTLFGLTTSSQASDISPKRLIQFKFEPLIIHILADSLCSAQKVLTAAQQAGFRESGATNIPSSKSNTCPMVAVRTNGLAFSSIVGVVVQKGSLESCEALVSESHLDVLVQVANKRFKANSERKEKFRALLQGYFAPKIAHDWEDAEVRRARKRAEGLCRRAELKGNPENIAEDEDAKLAVTHD